MLNIYQINQSFYKSAFSYLLIDRSISIYLSIYFSLSVSIYLSIYLSVCLSPIRISIPQPVPLCLSIDQFQPGPIDLSPELPLFISPTYLTTASIFRASDQFIIVSTYIPTCAPPPPSSTESSSPLTCSFNFPLQLLPFSFFFLGKISLSKNISKPTACHAKGACQYL
ncbi:unnamed protein product [Acanthosepion pharaonis]|uniref:Uncharacterized protein n=1 Tax=Acanthosepion pharaonis TaxID=158019 RepID=A0A812E0K4_ACAPH|nr:unnamed protein product [Sepia pharaonis]